MEMKGISVTVLDLVHFQGHYNPMAYLETDEDTIKLAFAIVNNTKPKDAPSGGDKFWDDSSVLLISALILYLMYEAPASEQNFSTLMYMLNAGKIKAFRIGRSYRIPKVNVIRFLQNETPEDCNTVNATIDSVE